MNDSVLRKYNSIHISVSSKVISHLVDCSISDYVKKAVKSHTCGQDGIFEVMTDLYVIVPSVVTDKEMNKKERDHTELFILISKGIYHL